MLVNCKSCGKEIGKGVKKCVHCGADQRNWFSKHKVLTGILAFLVIGIIGYAIDPPSNSPKTVTPVGAVAPVSATTALASTTYENPMSWAAYRATRPKTDTRMALTAKLSDYYNYDYRDLVDTYWAVNFTDLSHKESADTTGYIKKDTPDGKTIFEILKDGMSHNMILESKYKANDGSNTVEITKFVQEIK